VVALFSISRHHSAHGGTITVHAIA